MKKNSIVLSAAMALLAGLACPIQLCAQHHHYKLIDLGTLGGPHSYGSVNGDGFSLLNNSGEVASYADLLTPDPKIALFQFVPDGCSLRKELQT